MNSILITGASGFIGYSLSNYFSGYNKVICLSRSSTIIRKNLRSNNKLIWEKYNSSDPKSISRIINKYNPSEIIHAAGLINGTFEKLCEANFLSCKSLVKGINMSDSSPKLIFISSVSANLKTPYGESKAKGEEEIKNYKKNKFLILRLSLVYGKYQNRNLYYFDLLLKKLPIIPVPYSKNCLLQPFLIDDLGKIITSFMRSKELTKNIYVVAGPDRLNLIEIIKILKNKKQK